MTKHPNNTRFIASLAGTLGVTTVAATIGLLAIYSSPSTVARPRLSAQATIRIQQPREVVSRQATMPIIASSVINSEPSFFIGTGDGSAGFWTRQ